MTVDPATWWLAVLLLGFVTGGLVYLLKRSVFGRIDKMEDAQKKVGETSVKKEDYEKVIQALQADIKQISEHRKDLDECRGDIKQIKEDYITKEDFFREQGKTDRKLDRIMDILLEMKGDKPK